MPVLFTAIDFGDPAGEVHLQVTEQCASDGAHARRADPARLFVRRQVELAALKRIEQWRPFGDPAIGLPTLDLGDEAAVAGSEILRAHVQSPRVTALARHASAAATAFIEKLNDMPGLREGLGG